MIFSNNMEKVLKKEKKLLKTREKNGESFFKEIGRIKEDSIRKPPSTAS